MFGPSIYTLPQFPSPGRIGDNPMGSSSTTGRRTLIVRIVRGNVAAQLVPAFHDLVGCTVDEVRSQDGVVWASVARQIAVDGGEEIVFATVWRDMPALYAWLGGSDLLDVPAPICRIERCLSGRELQYYEVIDTDVPVAEAAEAGRGR